MLVGIDIGGTKCAVICGDVKDGTVEIKNKIRFETKEYSSPYDVLERFASEIKKFDLSDIEGIGISCGGPLDDKKGIIMSPPNLPGWDNIEIVKYFENELGIRTFLQNDANACAVAEWKFGAAKSLDNVVFMTFGTGLGAGLILDGKLYSGTNGMAGELGHIRLCESGPVGYGKAGSFEGFCSGSGIAQTGKIMATELLQMGKTCGFCKSFADIDTITAKSIAESANDGNEVALEVYKSCGRRLGQGLSIVIDILNPQMIVIGSVFARSGDLMREEMQKVLDKECLTESNSVCKVEKAKLGEEIGDYAALAVATLGLEGIKNDK